MTSRLRGLLILPFLACSCAYHPTLELREIARVDTSGWAHNVALEGDRLYVADRQGGFLTLDNLRGNNKPRILVPVRDVVSLAPYSGMVVLASRFEGIVTVAPPGQVLDRFSIGDIANAVEVRGNLVFAAYGRHGLVILRLVKGRLQFVADLPTSGWSHDLRVSGDQVLVADWNGLKIASIHNPEKPSQIEILPSPATCISLDIKECDDGRLVAIAEGNAGISLVRLDAAGYPVLISRHNLGLKPSNVVHPESGGWIHSVAWAGQYLFAANWKLGLTVLDVHDPRNPRVILQFPTSGTALGVKSRRQPDGRYLIYLADGESGLRIFQFKE